MSNKININAAAARAFDGATKLRIRSRNGNIEIRPTNRIQGKYLPEGETLTNISFKRKGDKISGAVISNKLGLEAGTARGIVAGKYGWLVLVEGTAELSLRVAG